MFEGKRNGYDINLYRSPDNNWIAGVCGGIAENTGWPIWLVRLVALMLFSITGMFAVLTYFVAVIMLKKRTVSFDAQPGAYRRQPNLKDAVFTYNDTPGQQAKELHQRMKTLDHRLQKMETYVTSRRFQFDQEMKRS
ncbi:MAG: envelope stress response membrane protein PspC [Marinobacterium sp.]|nr:envelope stress response membrane protein PspC [Marinobacterium sp.]